MYTSTLLAMLLTSTALALPNMLPKPHVDQHAQRKRHTSANYDTPPEPTSTATITVFTTVYTPTATLTKSAFVTSHNGTTATPPSATLSTSIMRSASAKTSIMTATSTSATSPTSAPGPSPLAGVYICSDINWSGNCTHYLNPLGSAPSSCILLNGTASSIGPDPGFSCNFYTNSYCDSIFADRNDVVTLEYPGTPDLRSLKQGEYNDRFFSYQCFASNV